MLGELKDVPRDPNGVSVTVPENPFLLARSIFDVSDPPCARVI